MTYIKQVPPVDAERDAILDWVAKRKLALPVAWKVTAIAAELFGQSQLGFDAQALLVPDLSDAEQELAQSGTDDLLCFVEERKAIRKPRTRRW